jgi:hypothetical protein
MEAIVTDIKKLREGQVSKLWWYGPYQTHIREIQCRDSLPTNIAGYTDPIAEGGLG